MSCLVACFPELLTLFLFHIPHKANLRYPERLKIWETLKCNAQARYRDRSGYIKVLKVSGPPDALKAAQAQALKVLESQGGNGQDSESSEVEDNNKGRGKGHKGSGKGKSWRSRPQEDDYQQYQQPQYQQ